MATVNMHDAKSRLSKLADAVRFGIEAEVVIAKNGVPWVRIVPLQEDAAKRPPIKFGLAKGKWIIPDDFDAMNPEIEKLFYGEES